MSGLKLPATTRLLMVTVSSAMIVNNMNKQDEILNDFTKSEITTAIKEKFDDL